MKIIIQFCTVFPILLDFRNTFTQVHRFFQCRLNRRYFWCWLWLPVSLLDSALFLLTDVYWLSWFDKEGFAVWLGPPHYGFTKRRWVIEFLFDFVHFKYLTVATQSNMISIRRPFDIQKDLIIQEKVYWFLTYLMSIPLETLIVEFGFFWVKTKYTFAMIIRLQIVSVSIVEVYSVLTI